MSDPNWPREQMVCEQVRLMLWALLDGELDRERSSLVDEHCQECSPCDVELRAGRSVKDLLSRSCACQPAPARLRVQIVAAIRQVTVVVEAPRPPE